MRYSRISIDSGTMSKAVSDRFVKSFLDLFVLELLDDGPKHGYEIMRELKIRTGARIGAGTLYPLLYELEDQKLVAGNGILQTGEAGGSTRLPSPARST